MPASDPRIDARERKSIDGLVTSVDATDPSHFLERCTLGSTWIVSIRTATVRGTISRRTPLATFDETACTCLTIELDRPVPVEPGLRFRFEAEDQPEIKAAGVIRPWSA